MIGVTKARPVSGFFDADSFVLNKQESFFCAFPMQEAGWCCPEFCLKEVVDVLRGNVKFLSQDVAGDRLVQMVPDILSHLLSASCRTDGFCERFVRLQPDPYFGHDGIQQFFAPRCRADKRFGTAPESVNQIDVFDRSDAKHDRSGSLRQVAMYAADASGFFQVPETVALSRKNDQQLTFSCQLLVWVDKHKPNYFEM